MSPRQMKLVAEVSPLPPPPPPFPGALGLPSGETECKSVGKMGISLEGQQQTNGWGFQGFNGGEGYFSDDKSVVVELGNSGEGEGESFDGGKDRESGHSKLCARGHWRPAEDAKLRELVSQYGPQNWNLIAEKLEARSGKSCRLRWFNQLDPRINKRSFSEEEEERLLNAHRLYGNKWALIARLFPGRTDNAVKNHWHVIMARKHREQSSSYRRRHKPSYNSTLQAPLKKMEININNNACSGESTSTSTRDESPSTCTDLSLNSSSSRVTNPCFLTRFSPPQQPLGYEFLMGFDEKMVEMRNGCHYKFGDAGVGFYHGVLGVDQSGYSDSNSDASATESSVATKQNRAQVYGEADHERDKIKLPFIDFLGVGTT